MTSIEPALDLLSTSQTFPRCAFGAPLVALRFGLNATISQACCNHWECPRCGLVRAKQEYHRMVWGCEVLADDHDLYFWTITCRGRECSYDEAIENYLAWTNKLFTNARKKCKTEGGYWAYVQVTEHQKRTRAHPHSHIITTFLPSDAVRTTESGDHEIYASAWFARANHTAGLGSQHKLSRITSAAGVSRYVAKYLFKDSISETWPPKWKRIRYSQNWPDPPARVPDFVRVLRSPGDWRDAEQSRCVFICETYTDYEISRHRMANIALRRDNVPF